MGNGNQYTAGNFLNVVKKSACLTSSSFASQRGDDIGHKLDSILYCILKSCVTISLTYATPAILSLPVSSSNFKMQSKT